MIPASKHLWQPAMGQSPARCIRCDLPKTPANMKRPCVRPDEGPLRPRRKPPKRPAAPGMLTRRGVVAEDDDLELATADLNPRKGGKPSITHKVRRGR